MLNQHQRENIKTERERDLIVQEILGKASKICPDSRMLKDCWISPWELSGFIKDVKQGDRLGMFIKDVKQGRFIKDVVSSGRWRGEREESWGRGEESRSYVVGRRGGRGKRGERILITRGGCRPCFASVEQTRKIPDTLLDGCAAHRGRRERNGKQRGDSDVRGPSSCGDDDESQFVALQRGGVLYQRRTTPEGWRKGEG